MRKAFQGMLAIAIILAPFSLSFAQNRGTTSIPPAGFEGEVITNGGYTNPFNDTDMSTLEGRAAAYLYYHGVIGGYTDGTFRPDQLLNRAEWAKFLMLAKHGGIQNLQNTQGYWDMKEGEWYVPYVMEAVAKGVMKGYPDGALGPERTVNKAEAVKMIVKTYGIPENLAHTYRDVSGEWFAAYAGAAQKYNLFPLDPANEFNGSRFLTRGDTAVMLYQLLKNWDSDTPPVPPIPNDQDGQDDSSSDDDNNGSDSDDTEDGDMDDGRGDSESDTHQENDNDTDDGDSDSGGEGDGDQDSDTDGDGDVPSGGDLLLVVESLAQDGFPGETNKSMGIVKIANYGEPVRLESGLRLIVKHENFGTNEQVARRLKNIRLRDLSTGKIAFGPTYLRIHEGQVKASFIDSFEVASSETAELELLVDIAEDAPDGAKFFLEVEMGSVKVKGLHSNQISTGGQAATGPHDITPPGNPSTRTVQIRTPRLNIQSVPHADNTFVARQDEVLLWEAHFSASGDDLVINKLVFEQLGTADDATFDSCAVFTSRGGHTRILEARGVTFTNGTLELTGFDADTIPGVNLSPLQGLYVQIACDVSSSISVEVTARLSLDVSETEVVSESGHPVTKRDTTDIEGALYYVVQNGTLEAALSDTTTPDPQNITFGDTNISVAVFELEADAEPVEIKDMIIHFDDLNTNHDFGFIEKIRLYNYATGQPIKQSNGQDAQALYVESNGNAIFENLEFIIPNGDELKLEVRVDTNTDFSYGKAVSFAVQLLLDSNQPYGVEVRGQNSGEELQDDSLFMEDEAKEATRLGEAMTISE